MNKIYYSTAKKLSLAELKTHKRGSWLHISAPSEEELPKLAKEYSLDESLLKDALDLYEAPRVERDGEDIFVYTRYFNPDNGVINATEPLLIIYRPEMLITLQRTQSDILDSLTSGRMHVITTQKTKTLLQILEAINKSYQGYVTNVTRKIFSARSQLRGTNISDQTLLEFVQMEDDLNEFLSALQPQAAVLRTLLAGKHLRLYEEDKDLMEDLSLSTKELIDLVVSRLKTIVTIRESYDAIAASELNRTFKRLTSISIFLMIPTVFSGLYGMNLALPFAENKHAFFIILGFVLAASVVTVMTFRKKRWL